MGGGNILNGNNNVFNSLICFALTAVSIFAAVQTNNDFNTGSIINDTDSIIIKGVINYNDFGNELFYTIPINPQSDKLSHSYKLKVNKDKNSSEYDVILPKINDKQDVNKLNFIYKLNSISACINIKTVINWIHQHDGMK